MSDKLKSIPIIGAPAAAFGFAKMSDNHGNEVKGRKLTCGSQKPIELSADDWYKLHMSIERPHGAAALEEHRTDGIIPVLGGMESPLKTMCDGKKTPSSTKKLHR